MNEFIALASLFISSFGAATFLPIQSEIILLGLAHNTANSHFTLWLVATTGNTLGALLNYYLGTQVNKLSKRKWFPIKPDSLNRAKPIYKKWGKWSLLLAWVPIIGDPLTLIAGIFRTSLWWFIPLVTIGKAGRYAGLLIL